MLDLLLLLSSSLGLYRGPGLRLLLVSSLPCPLRCDFAPHRADADLVARGKDQSKHSVCPGNLHLSDVSWQVVEGSDLPPHLLIPSPRSIQFNGEIDELL